MNSSLRDAYERLRYLRQFDAEWDAAKEARWQVVNAEYETETKKMPLFKYLHEVGPNIYHLDHRLTPEVRAMLAAMASRLPAGGIQARYAQLVAAVAETQPNPEDRLTEYPLHPKVQGFFDEFVGRYGHSSIQEQTGDPAIYVEGVSWLTNWLLFDSPLVAGQEFSTRAVRYKDWPMAREATHGSRCAGLQFLHEGWLEVFEAEVAWWADHLTDPANRAALGIGDKEPFRPALDRARWALPGTIATGACFTSNLRERARVLRDTTRVCGPIGSVISAAYEVALPGIAPHALRPTSVEMPLPGHLENLLSPVVGLPSGASVDVSVARLDAQDENVPVYAYSRPRAKTYADPWMNRKSRVSVRIDGSLAVARDWHRHRTLYPWHLGVVLGEEDQVQIAAAYSPRSALGLAKTPELLKQSSEIYCSALANHDKVRAALALPLGTRVVLSGSGGYRDVLYMLELRAFAHGANFEYRAQALEGLSCLSHG
jgi:hypothetical protein